MSNVNASRLRTVVAWLLGAAVCLVLVWQICFAPARSQGSVSIGFAGFTNNASGAVSAIFTASNGFPREVVFAAGAVQIRETKGWPAVSVYGHPAGPVFTVVPNGMQLFVMPLPKVDGLVWRVPLHYELIATKLDLLTIRIKVALGLGGTAKPALFTNTPEMLGVSTRAMEPAGASRFLQDTNQAP